MVGEIATRHALSKDVIAGVSERSGGVPLFVEEVTRLLLERGEQGGVQAIPPTLQQSLAARLDRLGSAREIAQIGAVLGRGFSHALLKSSAGDAARPGSASRPVSRAALDQLADAELLFVEGVAPHANYRFKHALIQDAAYDSLLKSRRQTLHRRAAEVLLASPAPEAEALAHHFTQAGQTELAIEWWGKAGDQALRRSAFAEAISHLGKAIELSDKAGGAARPREAAATASASQRLKLQTDYGQAVMWSKGFAAEETKAAFARVGELATRDRQCRGAARRLLRSVGPQFFSRRAWVGPGNGRELPARSGTRGAADGGGGRASHFRIDSPLPGRFRASARRIANRRCEFTIPSETAKPSSASVRTLESRRPLIWLSRLGASATSDAHGSSWTRRSRARSNPLMPRRSPTRISTRPCSKSSVTTLKRPGAPRKPWSRSAESTVLRSIWPWAALPLAWARAKLGDRDAGSTEFRQALAEYASQGNKLFLPFYQGLLAEIEAEGGDAEAALAGIDGALALAGETGEHWFDAGLHRIRGEILLKQNPADPAPAEAAFLAAIAVAQQQKARSFELRAALSLAKLYQSTGRPIDAHDVLGPALEGFSPTPEFPQIAEAIEFAAAIKATGAQL